MKRERLKIFYCWQSDLPAKTNRNLIDDALRKAAMSVGSEIGVETDVDRDTLGTVGAVDIARTILSKIQEADLVVVDLSTIGVVGERPVPNPNVVFELGYALGTIGEKGLVIVINTAFGKPEDLPFDLRQRRVLAYACGEGDSPKAAQRKLETAFTEIIGAAAVVPVERRAMPPLWDTHKLKSDSSNAKGWIAQRRLPWIEFAARPSTRPSAKLEDLRSVFREVADNHDGWPEHFLQTSTSGGHSLVEPMEDGIRAELRVDGTREYSYWRLYDDGTFFHIESFFNRTAASAEDRDVNIWWTLQAFVRIVSLVPHLYRKLGLPATVDVEVSIRVGDFKNARLVGYNDRSLTNPMRLTDAHVVKTNNFTSELAGTISDLETKRVVHVREIGRLFFRLFDHFELRLTDAEIQRRFATAGR